MTINVKSLSDQIIQCLTLIDNASQNLLTFRKLALKLNLSMGETNHRVAEINGISEETCLDITEFQFTQILIIIKILLKLLSLVK